jgi:flagellar protein FlgJ
MSIFPPTDIVTEVAQAADPKRLQVAIARLVELSGTRGQPSEQFAALVSGVAKRSQLSEPGGTKAVNLQGGAPASQMPIERSPAAEANRKFEAFLIQSCLQTILPKEEHGFFGQGAAGGIWRSMIAEQLGNQIAKAGGIGLQKMLDHHKTQQISQVDGPPSLRRGAV